MVKEPDIEGREHCHHRQVYFMALSWFFASRCEFIIKKNPFSNQESERQGAAALRCCVEAVLMGWPGWGNAGPCQWLGGIKVLQKLCSSKGLWNGEVGFISEERLVVSASGRRWVVSLVVQEWLQWHCLLGKGSRLHPVPALLPDSLLWSKTQSMPVCEPGLPFL